MTDEPINVNVRVGHGGAIPERLFITSRVVGGRLVVPRAAWVHFQGAQLVDVDLSGQRFAFMSAEMSTFERCNFSNTSYDASPGLDRRPGTTFRDCTFDGTNMRPWRAIGAARFVGCSFAATRISGWRTDSGAEFVNNTFTGSLHACTFYGQPMLFSKDGAVPNAALGRRKNEFHRNDFRHASLVDCDFRYGVDVEANLWPDGPGYVKLDRLVERRDRLRADAEHWDGDRRRAADAMIRRLENPAYRDQPTVFWTIPTSDLGDPARSAVWDAVRAIA